MLQHSPLRDPPILKLWAALVFSAFGDEVYKIALIWIIVSIAGTSSGIFGAAQAASILFFSLVGGIFADGKNHRHTMIFADIFRAALVLLPPLLSIFSPLSFWMLLPVAVAVSGLNAFFDPALQAYLPSLTSSRKSLQRTNGLFDSTRRLARVLGPALAGFLQLAVPPIQFFTINAVTFLVSAIVVARLPVPDVQVASVSEGGASRLVQGFRAVKAHPTMPYLLVAHGIVNGGWQLGLVLSTALILQTSHGGSVAFYGMTMSAYGVGNVLSNIVVSRMHIRQPITLVAVGRFVAAAGFIALGLAPSPVWMMVAAAFAAIGAPLSNLPFLNILQHEFDSADIARIYRLRMVSEWAFVLLAMAISPSLFSLISPHDVIIGCGLATGLVGAYGLLWIAPRKRDAKVEE